MFGPALGGQEIIGVLFVVGHWGLCIWALVDCVRRDFPAHHYNVLWAEVAFLVPLVGAVIYLLLGRSQGTLRSPGGS